VLWKSFSELGEETVRLRSLADHGSRVLDHLLLARSRILVVLRLALLVRRADGFAVQELELSEQRTLEDLHGYQLQLLLDLED